MKPHFWNVGNLFVLAILAGVLQTSAAVQPLEYIKPVNTKTGKTSDVSVEVSVTRTSDNGKPVRAELTVRNGSSVSVRVADYLMPDCEAVLLKAGVKEPAELTTAGTNVLDKDFKTKFVQKELKPSESKTYKFDLAEFFELSTGDFVFAIKVDCYSGDRRIPKLIQIDVPGVEFRVVEK